VKLEFFDNTLLRIFGTKRETVREIWRLGFHLGDPESTVMNLRTLKRREISLLSGWTIMFSNFFMERMG
jgi:hypothetical protein